MYCRNCCAQLDDRAIVCIKCGLPPKAGTTFCQNCGKSTVPGQVTCVQCGTFLTRSDGSDPRAHNKIAGGVCGILLGAFGVHKFILGYTNAGLIMLLCTIFTCGVAGAVFHVIGLVEGIIYLTKTDEEFVNTYVLNKREWF